ncbi:exo-beta-- [Lasallia pustulata]|uniref:Exo-beta n=1 Tax=Lasallia pustulata TaxID=136370 RepID=A0A1W5CV33_9LECA|nr:exo-beta-- [Lasallia pustulata]
MKSRQVEPVHEVGLPERVAARSCGSLTPSNPSTFWYEQITHNGESPFIPDGSQWKIFRNVVTGYSADNSGNTASNVNIQNAINDGSPTPNSRNTNSLGNTGQPAVVYFPGGTYTLNAPLQLYLGTVLMGNPLNPPTLKAGPSFSGNVLIEAMDPSRPAINNFYIAIKNLNFDSTNINKATTFTILDWSVAQGTQLSNCVFNMPSSSTGHTGVAQLSGGDESGTIMSDLTFYGGVAGINLGPNNEQYEIKSVTFSGCTTGIIIQQCFNCVLHNVIFKNNAVGVDMTASNAHSTSLVDSTASNVGIVVNTLAETSGDHSLVIENYSDGGGVSSVVTASGSSILTGSVSNTWVYGNAYPPGSTTTARQTGTIYTTNRPANLLSNGKYLALAARTYQEYDVTQFINVKSVSAYPVYGDGSHDDTANLNSIISTYAGCKILFFPHGVYIVTNTLFFPAGSIVVGEAWSTISASGTNFKNAASPLSMICVGNSGDVGVAQFSNMLFTVADVLPGCILVEVNIAGSNPGDVAFWNSHFRVGGAADSLVETTIACGSNPSGCMAAFLLLYLTASSSAYIEDMWGWTADHDLDGLSIAGQYAISVGRGMLLESTKATWLHGISFEHATLYQFNFNTAQNVFVAMQQCETVYWQGAGSPDLAPAPWTPSAAFGDPTFANCGASDAECRMGWFMYMSGSARVFIYGSAFWVFYNGPMR